MWPLLLLLVALLFGSMKPSFSFAEELDTPPTRFVRNLVTETSVILLNETTTEDEKKGALALLYDESFNDGPLCFSLFRISCRSEGKKVYLSAVRQGVVNAFSSPRFRRFASAEIERIIAEPGKGERESQTIIGTIMQDGKAKTVYWRLLYKDSHYYITNIIIAGFYGLDDELQNMSLIKDLIGMPVREP